MAEENKKIFDLVIIGAGPAGAIAGVYAARKKMKVLVITEDFFGQYAVSDSIENWPGEIAIPGMKLAKKFEEQLKYYQSDDFVIKEFNLVESIKKVDSIISDEKFEVETNMKEKFLTKNILITTGAKRRKLTVPGADKFEHKGVTYCASCDGPMFTDKDVVVIGGGNTGFGSASQLAAYCKSVTILQRGEKYNAEGTTVEKVLANKKITGILNAEISEVNGNDFVTGIKYKNRKTGEEKELKVSGVFVEIGAIPAANFISNDLVEKNKFGEIIVNHKTCQTSQKGIWAAGDINDGIYKQIGIAVGDGIKAVEDIYENL